MNGQRWILVPLLLSGLLLSLPVAAQRPYLDDAETHERVRAEKGGRYQDLDTAVSRIRKRTGGRVLSAETKSGKSGPVHHVRVITKKGKVRRFRVDANSGKLLPPSRKR